MHMAQLMPLPLTVPCFSKIQIGFTFLVPAHPGSPGKRAINGCVCVCVLSGTIYRVHRYEQTKGMQNFILKFLVVGEILPNIFRGILFLPHPVETRY